MTIKVFRRAASHKYRRRPTDPHDWHNNDAHNSLDIFEVLEGDKVIFSAPCQTVSNAEGLIEGSRYLDTIAPGPFKLKAFVDPRAFLCTPHGICDCYTIEGAYINLDSVTRTNKARWLVHDWKGHDGKDTRVAWSSGCLVLTDADLMAFSAVLTLKGIKPGDMVDGELIEEGD
jgi:hypothetical protein